MVGAPPLLSMHGKSLEKVFEECPSVFLRVQYAHATSTPVEVNTTRKIAHPKKKCPTDELLVEVTHRRRPQAMRQFAMGWIYFRVNWTAAPERPPPLLALLLHFGTSKPWSEVLILIDR